MQQKLGSKRYVLISNAFEEVFISDVKFMRGEFLKTGIMHAHFAPSHINLKYLLYRVVLHP